MAKNSEEGSPTKTPRKSFSDFLPEVHRKEPFKLINLLRKPDAVVAMATAYVGAAVRYSAYKTVDEFKRVGKYFKAEWNNTPEGNGRVAEFFRKATLTLKYTALLAVGVAACVPALSAGVGAVMGALHGIRSANRDGFGPIKSLVGAFYGAYVGFHVSIIPVVGVGLGSGLVKGSIEGMQSGIKEASAKFQQHEVEHPPVADIGSKSVAKQFGTAQRDNAILAYVSGLFTATFGERVIMGAVKGCIPIAGSVLVEAKLNRADEKHKRTVLDKISPVPNTPANTTKHPSTLDSHPHVEAAKGLDGVKHDKSQGRPANSTGQVQAKDGRGVAGG